MLDRLPISAVLVIFSVLGLSALSIYGFISTDQSPIEWLFVMSCANLAAFFVCRLYVKRYPKQLGAPAFLCGAAILAVPFALWVFESGHDSSAAIVPADSERAQSMAWLACQRLAKSKFKAPTQTDFEMYPIEFAPNSDGQTFSVQGVAHAPNSLGVKLRHLVVCDMQVAGDPESSSGWIPVTAAAIDI